MADIHLNFLVNFKVPKVAEIVQVDFNLGGKHGLKPFLPLFCTPSKGTYAGRQLIIASQFIAFPLEQDEYFTCISTP